MQGCTPKSIRPMQISEYANNYFAATEQHFCYSFRDEIVLLLSYFLWGISCSLMSCAIAPSLPKSPESPAQQLAQSQGVRGDSGVPHGDLSVQELQCQWVSCFENADTQILWLSRPGSCAALWQQEAGSWICFFLHLPLSPVLNAKSLHAFGGISYRTVIPTSLKFNLVLVYGNSANAILRSRNELFCRPV